MFNLKLSGLFWNNKSSPCRYTLSQPALDFKYSVSKSAAHMHLHLAVDSDSCRLIRISLKSSLTWTFTSSILNHSCQHKNVVLYISSLKDGSQHHYTATSNYYFIDCFPFTIMHIRRACYTNFFHLFPLILSFKAFQLDFHPKAPQLWLLSQNQWHLCC